ncbi:5-formyltetrahydrofolate cyclo-ligase [Mycolicibacterium thermoresistibile]|uniref:5-formyltetrahydrofolate cyclo-ligase n=2 Tax=Mycolicibacterium thermoresistibile TaxID=1797 RepID=G7CCI6_MYCT3|nr:5-formyltetrahydrofolate cyclo-ligase [Mycolicibacterium thermoresistibile]EHI14449.1 5-formyltetrahydrofolate cyclo-ligase [Mycolicibacterium thermoresistibile ATCC 19527]MCV7189612.1 5-formyltetrahydrofolate cyclo-ligase [Mycolicibacterium thermoresistibile]GAT14603.1 5,10-methenyltetrahydrofolate synthetase [Mycolicibacterium thermoresistibile]SNW19831.1 5,10-methenyltetrahydrofolate synthetase [Mycolicibacterium thermoresistibile]
METSSTERQEAKQQLRRRLLAARRAVTAEVRAEEAAALARHVRRLVHADETVCAYVPVGAEPGSLELVEALHAVAARVLLPVVRHDEDGAPAPLQWAEYRRDNLVRADYGLLEPAPPWLAADSVADAAVILVPALAVDRTGVRLGRGAGFYDRTLPSAAASALLVAVVRDDELVERLPAEPHDVVMTHALTPRRGLVPLSRDDSPARPGPRSAE